MTFIKNNRCITLNLLFYVYIATFNVYVRRPQRRLAMPAGLPSLNKDIIYLLICLPDFSEMRTAAPQC